VTEVLPLAVSFDAFSSLGFWLGVGVIAGSYTIFTLGLQLNVGFTGIYNFGQAGFMAVGAYSMVILVTDTGLSFWLAMPVAMLITMAFGLIVGLPSLRLRADYFAIATIAASEAIRLTALNARDLTGGAQGIFGFDSEWNDVQDTIEGWLMDFGWSDPDTLAPLFIVVWITAIALTFAL
jgi:branched-chain amino acid transport system permease protein